MNLKNVHLERRNSTYIMMLFTNQKEACNNIILISLMYGNIIHQSRK